MKRIQIFFKKYQISILVVSLLALVVLVYQYSDVFKISNVEISLIGNNELVNASEAVIREKIGYINEQKYFNLDINQLQQDVVSTSTFISDVFIFKNFPNRVTILISERIPYLSYEINSKRCVLFDSNGYVIQIDENNCSDQVKKYDSMLVLSDEPKVEFIVGQYSNFKTVELISDSLKIFNQLSIPIKKIEIKESIVKIYALKNKVYIFSFSQDLNIQLARLMSIVVEVEQRGYNFNTIDLRFKRPVLTVK